MEDFLELEQGTDLLLDEDGVDFILLESSGGGAPPAVSYLMMMGVG
jgi:hypothetical protein